MMYFQKPSYPKWKMKIPELIVRGLLRYSFILVIFIGIERGYYAGFKKLEDIRAQAGNFRTWDCGAGSKNVPG
jgi:hypothetical protein